MAFVAVWQDKTEARSGSPQGTSTAPSTKDAPRGVVTSMATSARNRKNLGFAEPDIARLEF
jgi:hypothetical protein